MIRMVIMPLKIDGNDMGYFSLSECHLHPELTWSYWCAMIRVNEMFSVWWKTGKSCKQFCWLCLILPLEMDIQGNGSANYIVCLMGCGAALVRNRCTKRLKEFQYTDFVFNRNGPPSRNIAKLCRLAASCLRVGIQFKGHHLLNHERVFRIIFECCKKCAVILAKKSVAMISFYCSGLGKSLAVSCFFLFFLCFFLFFFFFSLLQYDHADSAAYFGLPDVQVIHLDLCGSERLQLHD